MEKELKGKIKLYEDEIDVIFPEIFDIFKKQLCETLELPEEFLLNIRLYYRDEVDDKIEITNEEDYEFFIRNIKDRTDILILLIEIKEESDDLIKNYQKVSFFIKIVIQVKLIYIIHIKIHFNLAKKTLMITKIIIIIL